MVSCKQCNTHNSLDSAFCKKCGATLDAVEIELASEKLASTISDGNRLFADGRTDDALMVADTAVACNPSSAAAISLKGMCLERKGLLAEALECFETVVALQPDSTLDKLKVNDLKNMLVVEKFEINRAPDRRMALVGGMAAVMLVVACGAMFAKANAGAPEDNSKLVAMNQQPQTQTFGDLMGKDTETQQAPQNQTAQETAPQNNNTAQTPNQEQALNGNGRVNRNNRDNISLPPYQGDTLPRPGEGGDDNRPIILNVDPEKLSKPGSQNTATQNTGQKIDEDPGVLNNGGGGASTTQDTIPKNAPGIIEIEVSKGGAKPNSNNGGGEAAPTGNGRQALIATARSQMMSGNYSGAANNFERALRAGADQASTNQRLAQCYAHMGRNGDAVSAYGRAASAFEKSGNTQGADACRQAIKVLGG